MTAGARATIFMLHRFDDPVTGSEGMDPDVLRRGLEYLRRERYELVALQEILERAAGNGPPLKAAVAFTVDDGYADHATVAAPVFAEYDCPSTTFVTTGFIDGDMWFWWDRASYIFQHAEMPTFTVELRSGRMTFDCSTASARRDACREFVDLCKVMAESEKVRALAELADAAEVHVPHQPPAEYAPMSWEQLRRSEQLGMTFGPHTVTHPILARTSDEQCYAEVSSSWQRLMEQAVAPVPVFCYPNGGAGDFGAREVDAVKRAGMLGAVSGMPGYVRRHSSHGDADWAYRLPRFSFPTDLPHLVQYVSGLERMKQILRP
jgi:peptidoglycan/xylan/chitin deacetylase (PgdA/CDA1 family)